MAVYMMNYPSVMPVIYSPATDPDIRAPPASGASSEDMPLGLGRDSGTDSRLPTVVSLRDASYKPGKVKSDWLDNSFQQALLRAQERITGGYLPREKEEWRLPHAPVPSRPDFSRVVPIRDEGGLRKRMRGKHKRSDTYPKSRKDKSTEHEYILPPLPIHTLYQNAYAELAASFPSTNLKKSPVTASQPVYLPFVGSASLHPKSLSRTVIRQPLNPLPELCHGCRGLTHLHNFKGFLHLDEEEDEFGYDVSESGRGASVVGEEGEGDGVIGAIGMPVAMKSMNVCHGCAISETPHFHYNNGELKRAGGGFAYIEAPPPSQYSSNDSGHYDSVSQTYNLPSVHYAVSDKEHNDPHNESDEQVLFSVERIAEPDGPVHQLTVPRQRPPKVPQWIVDLVKDPHPENAAQKIRHYEDHCYACEQALRQLLPEFPQYSKYTGAGLGASLAAGMGTGKGDGHSEAASTSGVGTSIHSEAEIQRLEEEFRIKAEEEDAKERERRAKIEEERIKKQEEEKERRKTLYKAPKAFQIRKQENHVTTGEDPFSKQRSFNIPKTSGFKVKKSEKALTQHVDIKRDESNWKRPKKFELKKGDPKATIPDWKPPERKERLRPQTPPPPPPPPVKTKPPTIPIVPKKREPLESIASLREPAASPPRKRKVEEKPKPKPKPEPKPKEKPPPPPPPKEVKKVQKKEEKKPPPPEKKIPEKQPEPKKATIKPTKLKKISKIKKEKKSVPKEQAKPIQDEQPKPATPHEPLPESISLPPSEPTSPSLPPSEDSTPASSPSPSPSPSPSLQSPTPEPAPQEPTPPPPTPPYLLLPLPPSPLEDPTPSPPPKEPTPPPPKEPTPPPTEPTPPPPKEPTPLPPKEPTPPPPAPRDPTPPPPVLVKAPPEPKRRPPVSKPAKPKKVKPKREKKKPVANRKVINKQKPPIPITQITLASDMTRLLDKYGIVTETQPTETNPNINGSANNESEEEMKSGNTSDTEYDNGLVTKKNTQKPSAPDAVDHVNDTDEPVTKPEPEVEAEPEAEPVKEATPSPPPPEPVVEAIKKNPKQPKLPRASFKKKIPLIIKEYVKKERTITAPWQMPAIPKWKDGPDDLPAWPAAAPIVPPLPAPLPDISEQPSQQASEVQEEVKPELPPAPEVPKAPEPIVWRKRREYKPKKRKIRAVKASSPIASPEPAFRDALDFLARYCIVHKERVPRYQVVFNKLLNKKGINVNESEESDEFEPQANSDQFRVNSLSAQHSTSSDLGTPLSDKTPDEKDDDEFERTFGKKEDSVNDESNYVSPMQLNSEEVEDAETTSNVDSETEKRPVFVMPPTQTFEVNDHLDKLDFTLGNLYEKKISLQEEVQQLKETKKSEYAKLARQEFREILRADYDPNAALQSNKKEKKGKKKKGKQKDSIVTVIPVVEQLKDKILLTPIATPTDVANDDWVIGRLNEFQHSQLEEMPELRTLTLRLERAEEKLENAKERMHDLLKEKEVMSAMGKNIQNQELSTRPAGQEEFRRKQSSLYQNMNPQKVHDIEVAEVEPLMRQVNRYLITEKECQYVYHVLDLPQRHRLDFKLFTVVAALSEKVSNLEPFIRKMINKMDFEALDVKMNRAKELFYLLEDEDSDLCGSGEIPLHNLQLELEAGGLSPEHVQMVVEKFGREGKQTVDFLDFLTYILLFIDIHDYILSDPLNSSRDR